MANQELFKLENAVRKAEGAWDRQMKRDGHLKKESRDISTADPTRMSPTARAFYHEYTAAKSLLDGEAGRTDLFGGTPASPATFQEPEGETTGKKAKNSRKGATLTVVAGGFPPPDEVLTPEDMTRQVVAPEMYNDLRALYAGEGLYQPKPVAKVTPLNDQHWVVTEVAEYHVVLNRCIPEDNYEGDTFANMEGREPGDWAGLLFKTGKGNSPSFVMLNNAQTMAALPGDPLQQTG